MSTMNSGANQRHEIPTHLEVEDRILFGLTLRQGIVVLVGLSIGYSLYAQLGNLPWPDGGAGGHPPLVLRVAVAFLPALLALAVAVVQPAGRPLEEWLFALTRYAALPKRYIWRPRIVSVVDEQARGGEERGADALETQAALGATVDRALLDLLHCEDMEDRLGWEWEGWAESEGDDEA
jgi:hypothetical protein